MAGCSTDMVRLQQNGNEILQGGHKPGIHRDFSERGKLREFSGNSVQPQAKIVTNKVFLVRHSNICVKQLIGSRGVVTLPNKCQLKY